MTHLIEPSIDPVQVEALIAQEDAVDKERQQSLFTVKGVYLGHTIQGFRYSYTCERCQATFHEGCPEVSRPALCHQCVVGERRGRP